MKPHIEIRLVEGAINGSFKKELIDDEIGAKIIFEGIVRRKESGRHLDALRYEAYEPMTRNELHKLSKEIVEKFQLNTITVEHSIGEVKVREISFRLTLTSSHRAEAIAACDTFIKKMKQTIPYGRHPSIKRAKPYKVAYLIHRVLN